MWHTDLIFFVSLVPEGKFLHQINLEEKFGPVLKNVEQEPSKKRATVAIGYNYDDDNTNNSPMVRVEEPKKDSNALNSDEEKDDDSESDIDLGESLFMLKFDSILFLFIFFLKMCYVFRFNRRC